jgi:hypothetical protein
MRAGRQVRKELKRETVNSRLQPPLPSFFAREAEEIFSFYKHIFFLLFIFNNLSVFSPAEPGQWTTFELEGLPQSRAILTVKMPTEPIIIIIGGGSI